MQFLNDRVLTITSQDSVGTQISQADYLKIKYLIKIRNSVNNLVKLLNAEEESGEPREEIPNLKGSVDGN